MVSMFNYNTLEIGLNTENRSISINLNRPEVNHAINFEMLFELETILAWVASHIEINSVVISSTGKEYFSCGHDLEELEKIDNDKLRKFNNRLRKLTYSLFYLPQTVIFDLKSGAKNIALELAIGGDIRVIAPKCEVMLNHLEMGLTPACGAIGLLSKIINRSTLNNWILSGSKIKNEELIRSGLVSFEYANQSEIQITLETIANQAPIARIQAKRSLLEENQRLFKNIDKYEDSISFGSLITGDWKEWIKSKRRRTEVHFTPAKDLTSLIRNRTPLKDSTL